MMRFGSARHGIEEETDVLDWCRTSRGTRLLLAGLAALLITSVPILAAIAQDAPSTQPVVAEADDAVETTEGDVAAIPQEIIDGLMSLKGKTDATQRKALYDLMGQKGDARIVPALNAYRNGLLQVREDRLVMYGERVTLPDQGSVLPLVDAITGEPITSDDGKPLYFAKPDLSASIKAPPPAEKRKVADLIAVLSLNHPDAAKRRESIIAAGDRADDSLLTPLKEKLAAAPDGPDADLLRESIARIELLKGDASVKIDAVTTLAELRSSRSLGTLQKARADETNTADAALIAKLDEAIATNERYQSQIRFVHNTFAGLSLGSILVLLALGLSIIFGLMGVINMAHGEFMMVGAFTTFVVSELFKQFPGAFDYYLLAAVPAAFLVSAGIGLLVEWTVIRHLYGRPLETLLATWGIGLILIQLARVLFGDTLSVAPPKWMEGGFELLPDLILPKNRLFIIAFCGACVAAVYLIVNRTKLGLLLRATTQNREMAAALGVKTRRVDAMTFALGAGLAGLAGVVVPLYNKINPGIGQEYIVNSFMVVVVGGVGALAGAIFAGLGLGFLAKYLEPLLGYVPHMESAASVVATVLVLAAVVAFLNWRPAGLFPPRGRLADA